MKKVILLLVACCFFSIAFTQTGQIKGKVTDDKGSVISGVSIVPKGARTGTQSDANGNFAVNVNAGKTDLTFTYVGYVSKTVSAGAGTTITVQLTSANASLDEIVVVGYQAVRRKDLTAAVSSVSAKDLKDVPLNSSAEALAGRLAGVQVSVSEGTPGADVDIFVRGRNSITQSGSPLYVVDGIQLDNALSVLSPQDIESIDVLKDAAATAIYGARGSNGVILITTKAGKIRAVKQRLTIMYLVALAALPRSWI